MSIMDLWAIVNKNTELQISQGWQATSLCAYESTCASKEIMGEAHQDGKRHVAGDVCSSTEVSSPAGGQQEVPHRSKPKVSSCTKIKRSDLI